jgi:serine phosphatase RsbU (regulator of sigma subunit)
VLILPLCRPAIRGLDVEGMMQAASAASGDCYDYLAVGSHTTRIVIADVSGKAFPPRS